MSGYMDYEELAMRCCGLDEDAAEKAIDEDNAEEIIFNKFEVDLNTFERIARALVKFTPVLASPLTQQKYHVFGIQEEDHFTAIVKEEAE